MSDRQITDIETEPSGERTFIRVELGDGTNAELAPIGPQDRHLLLEGLSQMSEQSRFARFGSGRSRLSDSEIRYLTEVDQRSHVAWGARIDGHAAGVGRYIVGEASEAEIAVTVVDRWQRLGLGRALFGALVASARASGVEVLLFSIEPWNRAVIRMMRGFEVHFDEVEGMLSGRIEITDVPPGAHDAAFVDLLDQRRQAMQ